MSTIDFSHLRLLAVFATVVEVESFAAAARRLHSSRSRISEQVAQLESTLGVRLLQRSTRQLRITREGQQVYEKARQLPDILQGVEAITMPSTPNGRVVITMNHDIAHKYVLPVLDDFRQQYPQVQLDLVLNDEKLDLIGEQIDLGIRIGIPRDDSLIARVMHEERFAIFASPSYLLQSGQPKTVRELEKHRWISLTQTSHDDVQRLSQKGKMVEIRPRDFYRCNSPLMLQQMVVEGLGIGALLPTTVCAEIERGELVQLMPSLSSEPVVFSLVYPSRRQVPLRTRVLIDYLLEAQIFPSVKYPASSA